MPILEVRTQTCPLRSHFCQCYLEQTVAAHGPVAGPVTLVCGSVPKAVAPLFNHVKAFCMPNMRLQPDVLPLPAVKLQQQVSVLPAGLATLVLCLLLLLLGARLEALLPLEGDRNRNVSINMQEPALHSWLQSMGGGSSANLTILLATSLSLQGSRLVLWLMARLLMCLGRAPNTWQLPAVLETAFSMALTSADLARAKATAEGREGRKRHSSEGGGEVLHFTFPCSFPFVESDSYR